MRTWTTKPGAITTPGATAPGAFYEQLRTALPDLEIEVLKRHVAEENIVLEVMIRGTQMGTWRGLPGTGRGVKYRFAVSTRSTRTTDWRERRSTTTGPRF